MDAFVIVATKGRASECLRLIDGLAEQTKAPKAVVFVGSSASDVEGISDHPSFDALNGMVLVSEKAGSSVQRNVGVAAVQEIYNDCNRWFGVFFDDDFRPDREWIYEVDKLLGVDPDISAVTGYVVADGIKGPGITEEEAQAFLDGDLPPMKCWAQGTAPRNIDALYGCNMAVRGSVLEVAHFDERLPLYAWQEDRDFSHYARSHGRVIFHPKPRGVHLGVKSGRTSGLRMGYSQIANPVYLKQKQSISAWVCARFLGKAIIANVTKSLMRTPHIDYFGRLKGNCIALLDAIQGKMCPERILDLK